MIQDLHTHTYYSMCGKDNPETIINAAIKGGIGLLGITDHNHGAGFCNRYARAADMSVVPLAYHEHALRKYYDHINLLKDKYADRIKLLCGIEIATRPSTPFINNGKLSLPEGEDVSYFDYCLLEHVDHPESVTNGDIFSYAEKLGCPFTGIAHTNMFAFIKSKNEDPYKFFKRMAEQNIFWEMNVSYDSTHGYREHQYVLDFFSDNEQQDIVRRSGVLVSIGFDGHKIEDYLPERIADFNHRLTAMGIKKPFEN